MNIDPGAFQEIIDSMLAGLKAYSGYLDNVVVQNPTEQAQS